MAVATLVGRALDEFILREKIGQGASSIVYLADQPLLERQVVVKLSRQEHGSDSSNFLREARLASRIEHPFAAHIYGFGVEADGLFWIAMERVKGTPLTDFIAQGPMEPEVALPFVRRLCDVIHAAHEMGVIHRDIKPDNTMVTSRGGTLFPKLLDLGVALDQRGAGGQAGRQGTPAYMAPECWVDGKLATVQSDVYSLGILTYELLAGRRPFEATKMVQLAAMHARAEPPPLPDTVPAQARAAVAKAMAKRASERFATVQAFADALVETAGVSMDVVGMPRIDELTLAAATRELPQAIADAVVLLDATVTASRALHATHVLQQTIAQVVGVIALAAADRVGHGHQSTAAPVQALLQSLRSGGLGAAEWWRLARELCRPFALSPDVHPVPELVTMFYDGATQLQTGMDEWLAASRQAPAANAAVEAQRMFLLGVMPVVAGTLRSIQGLARYRLVSGTVGAAGGMMRLWQGARTLAGKLVASRAALKAAPGEHDVMLLTAHDTIAVRLTPYVREAEPTAGEATELFWVQGPGRTEEDTKHVALPQAFTIDTKDTWAGAIRGATATTEESPYMGLLTFSEKDSRLYFGREREVDSFVNRLRMAPWIAVAGPSGVGKSSFIRAGVLPALDEAYRIVMRPGPTPLATLRATLIQHGLDVREHMLRDPQALSDALTAHAVQSGWQPLVLVVDQFEELVTQCLDVVEQEQVATLLVRLAADAESPIRVVLTVRDDFLVRVGGLSALRGVISANVQLLMTPARDDLLRIVVEPARRAGYEFEDDTMTEAMVDEVAAMPGALAMLSFTCSKLWQLRDRDTRRLTRAAYRSLGGVGGALAQHAEALLAAMSESEQAVVREIFRHLVTADGTRAALSRRELVQVAGGPTADAVIEALIQGRLLLASEDVASERIEVVHETLITAWPRLVAWRAQDAETARLRDQLRVAAKQWHERGGDRGLLWRGDALTEYSLWRSRYPGRLTDLEEDFGRQSQAAAKRRKQVTMGALGVVLSAMTVAMIIFYGLRTKAVASQDRAEKSEAAAHASLLDSYVDQGRRALLAAEYESALLYLAAAFRGGKDTQAIRFMIARAKESFAPGILNLRHEDATTTSIEHLPDGGYLTGGSDGKVKRWDKTGTVVVEWSVFASGDKTMATMVASGTVAVANASSQLVKLLATDSGAMTELSGHSAVVLAMERLDDGALLTTDRAGQIRLWNVVTRQSIALGGGGNGVLVVARRSADRQQVLAGYVNWAMQTGEVRLWDLRTQKAVVLAGEGRGVKNVAWRPDGQGFATTSFDKTVKVWRRNGTLEKALSGHTARVYHVAFTHRGDLASAATDGTVIFWDVQTGTPKWSLTLGGPLSTLQFVEGEKTLLAATSVGMVSLLDVDSGLELGRLHLGGSTEAVAVNGDELAASTTRGDSFTYSLTGLPRASLLTGNSASPNGDVQVDGDNRFLVHSNGESTDVIDFKSRSLEQMGAPRAAVSANGIIALADRHHTRVFKAGTREPVAEWPIGHKVTFMALDATGRRLLTAFDGGQLELRDVATGVHRTAAVEQPAFMAVVADAATVVSTAGPGYVLTPELAVREVMPAAGPTALGRAGRVWAIVSDPTTLQIRDGTEVTQMKTTSPIVSLAFTSCCAMAGLVDGSLRSWNLVSTESTTSRAHRTPIFLLLGHRQLAITLAREEPARIWDESGLLIYEVPIPLATNYVVLSDWAIGILSDHHWLVMPGQLYDGRPESLDHWLCSQTSKGADDQSAPRPRC